MGPKTKAILVSSIALMAAYKALGSVETYVTGLHVVRAEITSPDHEDLNTLSFYPVLVESLNAGRTGQIEGDVNGVFYTAPPAPQAVPIQPLERLDIVATETPESVAPDPINFLREQSDRFQVQAILEKQGGAIINGKLFRVGDTINVPIDAMYQEDNGTVHTEQLIPTLVSVKKGGVSLQAVHSLGWEQAVSISLTAPKATNS